MFELDPADRDMAGLADAGRRKRRAADARHQTGDRFAAGFFQHGERVFTADVAADMIANRVVRRLRQARDVEVLLAVFMWQAIFT